MCAVFKTKTGKIEIIVVTYPLLSGCADKEVIHDEQAKARRKEYA
jgi:hypothetical protein